MYFIESIKYNILLTLDRYEKLIKFSYSKTLETFKFRFGEIEGTKKYNKRMELANKYIGIDIILKSKYYKEIVNSNYIISDSVKTELEDVINLVNDHYKIKIICYFINYNLSNFKYRLTEIMKNPKSISEKNFILRYGEKEGKIRYKNNLKTLRESNSADGYISKFGEEDGQRIFNEIQNKKKMTLEMCVTRHGKDKGQEVWDHFCNRNKGNWSLERQIELHGKKKGRSNYCNIKTHVKHTSSLEGYIEKHGEELGKKIWFRRMRNMWYNSSTDAYIKKYGLVDGFKIMKEKKDNTSLPSFIHRYGEIEGNERYDQFIKKIKRSLTVEYFIDQYGEINGFKKFLNRKEKLQHNNVNYYSKISQVLFDHINNNLNISSQFKIFYQNNNKEFMVYCKYIKRVFFYDFVIPSLKYCIEFNGDIWHANPSIYKPDDKPNPFNQDVAAEEIWERDQYKINFLESQGYTAKVIWEKDYHHNKGEIIQECVNEINKLSIKETSNV